MNLKAFFVFAILLCQCSVCHCQFFGKHFSYGIQLGVGKGGFWSEGGKTYGIRNHVVHSVGFYAGKFINKRFEPYVGLFYEEKGFVFDRTYYHTAAFLTSHVSLRYYPFKILGFHTIIGGYAGLLVKSNEGFNKFDWGTRIGLGYKFMIYKVYGIELQAISEIGLRHDGYTRDGRHILHLLKIGTFRYFK